MLAFFDISGSSIRKCAICLLIAAGTRLRHYPWRAVQASGRSSLCWAMRILRQRPDTPIRIIPPCRLRLGECEIRFFDIGAFLTCAGSAVRVRYRPPHMKNPNFFPSGMCSDFLLSKTFPNDVYALRIFQSPGFSFLTATGRFTVLDVSLPIDCIGTHLVQTAGATVDTKINA